MADKMIAFNRGVPPPESFQTEWLIECTRIALKEDSAAILQYGSAAGYAPLVGWLADTFQVTDSQVIIGQGSLQLLDILIHSFDITGKTIFVEQPTYDRPLTIFGRVGAQLRGFDLKGGCLDLIALENALSAGLVPEFFYLIPDFQNPSGVVMPFADRKKITALAKMYQFFLVEDATYRDLRYQGESLPSLYELAPEQVIYMSSFSKLISPGLRVGYMIAPDDWIRRMQDYAQKTYISGTFLSQATVYQFVKNGRLEEQLGFLKDLYGQRLSALLATLSQSLSEVAEWIEPQGGFFVGVYLKDGYQLASLDRCREAGLMLFDNTKFFLKGGRNFIRLPFCALTESEIEEGVKRLSGLISKVD